VLRRTYGIAAEPKRRKWRLKKLYNCIFQTQKFKRFGLSQCAVVDDTPYGLQQNCLKK